jgi:hypothetical protein
MSFYGHFGYIKITKGFMIKIVSLTGHHVYQYTLFVVTSSADEESEVYTRLEATTRDTFSLYG